MLVAEHAPPALPPSRPCGDNNWGDDQTPGSALNPLGLPILPHTRQGDNNWGDDRSLYPKGQLWLNPGHIMGKVVG